MTLSQKFLTSSIDDFQILVKLNFELKLRF